MELRIAEFQIKFLVVREKDKGSPRLRGLVCFDACLAVRDSNAGAGRQNLREE